VVLRTDVSYSVCLRLPQEAAFTVGLIKRDVPEPDHDISVVHWPSSFVPSGELPLGDLNPCNFSVYPRGMKEKTIVSRM
jgi:hypothetical protein